MQCAPKRSSDFQEVSDKGKELLEVRLQEDNCSTIIKDSEVSSLAWRNCIDYRCSVISFVTLESDGLCKIVALPLQYQDSLHVSFLPQMNQLTDERKLVQNGSASNGTYSVNSFRCKAIKSPNKPSSKFSWRRSCSSSALMPSDSSAISGIPIGGAKIHRYGKKNPRTKAKKKEIESMKTPDFVSAETGVSTEDSARGSLLLEACGNDDSDRRNGSFLCSTAQETFMPDIRASKNDFEQDSERIIQPLGSADSISLEIVEGNASEVSPSAANYNACGYENQPLNNNSPDSKCVSSNSDSDSLNLKLNDKKEGFGADLLKEQSSPSRENYCSHLNSVRDEVDVNAELEKANRGIEGCTVSETRSALPGKKTKQNKKLTGSSRMNRIGGLGSSQRRTGKENSHTVWQKVQKNNSGAQLDRVVPVSKQFKGICNPVGIQMPKVKDKKTGNRKQPKEKISRRLKRKNTSEQDKIYRPSKISSDSNASSMDHKPPNERLDIPSKGFDIRTSSSGLSARFQNDSTDKCTTSESFESTQVCLDGLMSDKLISDGSNSRRVENESSSLPDSCNSLNQSNPLKVQPPVYLPHLFFQARERISLDECSNQSRSPLQNRVPSGAECSSLTTLAKPDISYLKDANKQPTEFGTSENSLQGVNCNLLDPDSVVIKDIQHSRDGNHDPLEDECEVQKIYGHETNTLHDSDSVVIKGIQHSRDGNHDPLEDEREVQKIYGHDMNTLHDRKCQLDVDEHFNCKSSCEDASRMKQVVSNARRAQLASEAVQMKTGCPIAEFERFLHFSSPVISQRPKLGSCENSPRNQLGDVIPCSHDSANLSLGSLWKWYEKHGSYGLEIKAKGHENPNGFGADNSAFRAYFVPFLSAVQLFKSNKTHSGTTTGPVGLDSCVSNIKVKEPSIFSVLFPKPCTDDASVLRVGSQFHSSEQHLASEKKKFSEQSVVLKLSGESELIFEYFEGEQPQHRRPLFDKIHQLVDGRVQGKIYGDPTMLNSITLNDLHAESWYSVAWYPIYRIPDGNLRTAFLTYHSLGHFVRRTSQSNSRDTHSCLVCPVVGLQSYNAQNECWFEPRNSMSTFTPSLNPLGILDERLRTLEETASLMARAVVKKGNLNSENRQPDYEFFLSRRR